MKMVDTYQDQRESYEAITEESLQENIEDYDRRLDEICRKWTEGKLENKELREYFAGVFFKYFNGFIHANNLELIRPSIQSRWERFSDDYVLWKNGQKPQSNKGDIWLKYTRSNGDGVKAGDEASQIDKDRFFSLMKAFCVPLDYYKPAPKGTVFSSRRFGRFVYEMIVGSSGYWKDDGGLLSGNFQLGDVVTLTDCYGLRAPVKVTEHLTHVEKRERKIYADYIGNGHIEGYTTDRDREILISTYEGRVSSLYTEIDNDDRAAFDDFPLWQTEINYNYEIGKVTWNVIENLIKRYLNESYESVKSDNDEYPDFIIYRQIS